MASLTKVKINNIDTSIEYFADPLLLLNFGSTLANTDIGFIFNRDGGISSNVALYWDETRDRISVAYTTTTGLPNGNIALSSYANIAAAWYFGNIAGGTTGNVFISANVLPTGNAVYNFGSPTARWNVGYFAATTLDLGGSQISVDPTNGFKFTVGGTGTPIYLASNGAISGTTLSSATTLTVGTSAAIGTTLGVGTNITAGGYINAAGNILSTGGVFNALTVNGNESVTGYVNVTGNVLAAVFNGGQVAVSGLINTAGNVLATAGTFNALTVNGNESVTGYLNVTGNILATQATFNGITGTGYFNTTGNISTAQLNAGQINTTGNIVATSGIYNYLDVNGNVDLGLVGAISGSWIGIRGNITQTSSGGAVYINTTGNVIAAGGIYNALTVNGNESVTGYLNVTGNVMAAVVTASQFNTPGNVLATAGTFNAVTVNGVLNATGNILSTGAIHNLLTVNGNATIGAASVAGVVHSVVGNVNQSGAGTIFYNTPGNIMAAIGQFGSITSTGFINTSANISAGQGQFATINASGLINTTANISASLFSGGQLYVSGLVNAGGNILAQSAIFNFLDVNGNISVGDVTVPGAGHSIIGNITQSGAGTIFYNTPGNIMAAIGRFGQISSDGLINTSANVMAATGRFGTVLSDGFINTSANVSAALHTGGSVVVSGLINTAANILTSQITVFGNAVIGAITTPGVVHNLVGNISQSGAGTIFFNTPGNVMAALGQFGAVNVSGYVNAAGNISTAQLNAGQINTTGNVSASQLIAATLSTRSAYGNIHLTQFASIFAEGNSAENQSIVQVSTTGLSDGAGMWAVTGLDSRVYSSRGIAFATGLTMRGQDTPTGGVIKVAITAAGDLWANAVTTSTSTSTGALVVGGGVGIGGNVIAGGYINTAGNLLATAATVNALTVNGFINVSGNVIANTLEVGAIESSGVIYANSATAGTSSTTGALIVAGGIGVAKDSVFGGNLTINGNLFINGNTTVFNTNNLSINDSLIYLADDNPADSLDIGFVSSFTNPGYQHTGFARDASDGVWKLFANVVAEPTTTIDFTNATYSNLLIGNLLARQATITGLNSAGYINTSGNVSAAAYTGGTINVSGVINTAGNILSTGAVHNSLTVNGNTTVANIITTGAGQFSGPFNETTTVSGVYAGNLNLSPRVGFFNGTAAQNWQIDNNFGTFRWYTPGVTRMSLDSNGNLAVNSYANISLGSVTGDSALQIVGNVGRGGAGYHDFLRVTSTASGATNPNKFFRLNGEGTLQIINSAYTANPLSLTDDGRLSISGNITAGSLTIPGAQHVLNGNVQINAIGSIQVPVGTTLQRPGSSIAGQIRFNTDTNAFEGYGNAWAAIGGGGSGGSPGGVTTTFQYNFGGAFGGIPTMNYIAANSAIIISTGTTSTSTGTGALQIVGGLGITENINTGGSITTTGLINTSANVSASQVSAGTIKTTGVVNSGGNVLATGGVFNALNVNGNIAVGAITTPGAGHTIVGNVTQSGAGTIFYNTPGNILAAQGSFGTVNATGLINTAGNVVAAVITASQFNTAGNILAAGAVFNSERVNGTSTVNVLNSTGNILGTGGILNSLTVNGATTQAGTLTVSSGFINSTGNIIATGGILNALTVNGTATVSILNSTGNILSTGAVHNSLTVNGATTQAGTLTVSSGFLNCAGNIVSTGAIHNALTVNGGITSSGYLNTSGNISAAIGSFGTLIVGSTAVVTNLNADLWDGNHFATYLNQAVLTTSTPSFSTVTSTVATGTAPFTVASTTTVTNLSADTLDGIHAIGLYNNMGDNHATRTAFDAAGVALTTNFGYRYVQGATNGPGTNSATQYYSWNIGLGNDYAYNSYAAQFALPRNVSTPYLSVRYEEAGVLGAWQKIAAGSADSAGTASTAGTVTTAAQTAITSVGILTSLNTSGNVLATGGVFNALTINGTATTQGVVPASSNVYSVGSTTAWYSALWGKAVNAQYADLAENYTSDSDYESGTVLIFGGIDEVTISSRSHDPAIAGVVSTNPAYHMNYQTEGVAVALQGRVPTKVKGPVNKGDCVVASDIPGVAQRLVMMHYQPGCIIGKSLGTIEDDSIQTIEVVVGRL
jgi:hypothetical protein